MRHIDQTDGNSLGIGGGARWSRPGLLAFALGILVATAPLVAPAEPADSLRTIVGKWLETMQKVQAEDARWTREKQVLEANRTGLVEEIADLEDAIAAARQRLATADQDEREKLEQKRRHDAARESLAAALTAAETRVREILPLLPEFLLKENSKLAPAVETVRNSASLTPEQRRKDLAKRLGALVTVLTESEKFQQQAWVRTEKQVVGGERMLVTAIYFGLSTAFAADEAGTVALRGRPGPQGWQFEVLPEPDTPRDILELIEVATGKGEIKFVEIPLDLRCDQAR